MHAASKSSSQRLPRLAFTMACSRALCRSSLSAPRIDFAWRAHVCACLIINRIAEDLAACASPVSPAVSTASAPTVSAKAKSASVLRAAPTFSKTASRKTVCPPAACLCCELPLRRTQHWHARGGTSTHSQKAKRPERSLFDQLQPHPVAASASVLPCVGNYMIQSPSIPSEDVGVYCDQSGGGWMRPAKE